MTYNNFCAALDDKKPHLWEPNGFGEPTQARPGSPEKVAIIEQRLAQGLEIWHPDDFKARRELLSVEIAECFNEKPPAMKYRRRARLLA